MIVKLNEFPLSGLSLSTALRASAGPELQWIVNDIETLAVPPATSLGDLWRRVHEGSGPVRLNTTELCGVLLDAKQVISLDVQLVSDQSIRIVVEDGAVTECGL